MTAPVAAARSIYRWCALLALPGGVWTALEMYGLTLGGPQMLFFSIAHTLAPMILAVFLSFPMGLLWLIQSVFALFVPHYRAKLGLHIPTLCLFAVSLSFHTLTLWFYDFWSDTSALRVAICCVGLVFSGAVVVLAWLQLRQAVQSTPPLPTVSDRADR